MRSCTRKTFSQIVCCIRCIKEVLLSIECIDICCHHRLSCTLGIHDILVVSVFHNECVVSLRRKVILIGILQVRRDQLLQSLTASSYDLFRNAAVDQCLCCRRELSPGIYQLHIKELFHGTDRLLPVLAPDDPVIAQELGCIRIKKLPGVLFHQNSCFSYI